MHVCGKYDINLVVYVCGKYMRNDEVRNDINLHNVYKNVHVVFEVKYG